MNKTIVFSSNVQFYQCPNCYLEVKNGDAHRCRSHNHEPNNMWCSCNICSSKDKK